MTLKKSCRLIIDWLARQYGWGTILSSIAFAISGAWSQMPNVFNEYRPDDFKLFIAMVIAPVLITLLGVARSKSYAYEIDDINEKNKSNIDFFQKELLDIRKEVLNEHLWEISEELNFTMQERICIYHFLDGKNEFECIGRYSAHPEYRKPSARSRYPLKTGVIGHVWNNGESNGFTRDDKFPDPKTRKESYLKYLEKKYGISRKVANQFRMNSIDIIAEILRDTKSEPVAVIVFESQRKNFLDEKNLDFGHKKRKIITLIENLKEQNPPDLETAREVNL